jgi:predicted MFS family arabinose efflux permease
MQNPANEKSYYEVIRTLLVSNFLLFLGFNLWRTLFNNFAVEELSIGPAQVGMIQSLREIPGLLGFAAGFLAMLMSEMRIMALSVVILGVGLMLTGASGGFISLTIFTFLMSVGFHWFHTASSSAAIMACKRESSARALGALRSAGALSAVLASAIAFFLVDAIGFRGLFYAFGSIITLGGLAIFLRPYPAVGEEYGRKVKLKTRYMLYYLLTFFMGSRRHIFTTFAIFLLVSVYEVNARTIALLFMVNNLVGTLAYREVGKVVARFGERICLAFNFLVLIAVFLGYGYWAFLPGLFFLFVLDNTLFGFSLALHTYLQRIAKPEDISGNVSIGQTINHVSALIVPVAGGYLWKYYGYETTFLAGAAFIVVSLVLTAFMPGGTYESQRTTAATDVSDQR